ncbi:hypothetical protein [Lewinella sp. JB7]|uniref:hypothetical protein n=1 Tax=Lewinella sp. JB7 TaxID=2962887 RepID=UPI0020C97814|nr:hypothetical protein [Lewinella sp. JB7]MCP9234654.1 hypothetical protein [Lewinella sp. JB7]
MPLTATDPTRNPRPLLPDGTFRGARLPAALAEAYVRVDEKADTTWVEFVRRLARQLNYVNALDAVEGNWAPFYDKQGAVAAARLITWPIERLGQRLAEHRELIEDRQGTIDVEQLFDSLFDLLTSAAVNLDRLTDRLPSGTPLRERAEALITHQLAPALRRWFAYHRAGAAIYFSGFGPDEVPDYLRDAYAAGGQLFATQDVIDGSPTLSARWTGGLSWTDYLAEVGTDEVVYGDTPSTTDAEDQILHAVGHVFFHGIYEAFVSAALHLRSAAQSEWQRLQTDPHHAPHLALLLAFLRVREAQRDMLNGLTDRHLSFYYQRVLRTLPAAARPPRALLYLEARKNLPSTYLPVGTAFRGGKDPVAGGERIFLSEEAVTVSEAVIKEKRAVLRVADDPTVYDFPGENRKVFSSAEGSRYYAATVVDSADGLGETDLPEDQEGFYPFGHRSVTDGHLVAGAPAARLGIAIASPYLLLREGERIITFRFRNMAGLPAPGVTLRVYLTTAEGWHETTTLLSGTEATVTLSFDAPAVVPYTEEIHQQGLSTRQPVVRLELAQESHTPQVNRQLFGRNFSGIGIGLVITGIRQLALSGSAGGIDPAKPFHPFGPLPRKGDILTIGNAEAFQKPLTAATFHWSWADPAGSGNVTADAALLTHGSFQPVGGGAVSLNGGSLSLTIGADHATAPTNRDDRPYRAGDARGYARLKLLSDWGHADYPTELAEWAAGKAAGETANLGIVQSIAQEAATFYQATNQAQLAFSASAAQAIENFSGTVYTALSQTITNSSQAFSDAVAGSLQPLITFVAGLPGSAMSATDIDNLVSSLPASVELLKQKLGELVEDLNAGAPGALETLAEAIPAAIDDYRSTVDNTLAPLLGNVSTASSAVLVANSSGAPAVPFNPLFAELTLDYTVDLAAASVLAAQEGMHELFHLTPFGSDPLAAAGSHPVLPTPLPQSGTAVGADAGALYLGIEQWTPGSQLSLLLQIVEGTADPLLEKPEDHLRWHYLSNNQWVIFPTDKVADGTEGLLRSGLVRLDLPAGIRPQNTRFGDALQWVRISVEEKIDAVNLLRGVHAHGVEVVQSFSGAQTATDIPLPAGTIAKLVHPLPGIKTVAQPYPTFHGAAPESRDAYFTRLSERLRHKDRAITEWDVEHLVLGAFPEVERVICLQHVEFEPGAVAGTYTYHELRAGHFTVLPMGTTASSGLRPYVSLSTREGITDFLRARISCHATLHVRNPLFEEVRVRADINYHEGTDISWAETQIQSDLIDYISPWHDGGLQGIDFAAEVHQSGVVNFLEELPYVNFVKNLVLLHLGDPAQNGAERLRSTKLVSVLASAPTHLLTTVYADPDTGPAEVCQPPRRTPRRTSVTITDNPPIQ